MAKISPRNIGWPWPEYSAKIADAFGVQQRTELREGGWR